MHFGVGSVVFSVVRNRAKDVELKEMGGRQDFAESVHLGRVLPSFATRRHRRWTGQKQSKLVKF